METEHKFIHTFSEPFNVDTILAFTSTISVYLI